MGEKNHPLIILFIYLFYLILHNIIIFSPTFLNTRYVLETKTRTTIN